IVHVRIVVAEHRIGAFMVNACVEFRVRLRGLEARRGIAEEWIDAVKRVLLEETITPRRAIDRTIAIVGERQHVIAPQASLKEEAQTAANISIFTAQRNFRDGTAYRNFRETD